MTPTPNFNTPIPAKIMTPDRVSTRLGTLEFFDGMPTDATAAMVLEHLTFLRAVEVFLSTIPAASLEAMRAGLDEFGATAANKVVIFDDLADSNSLFLTGNTDTVYALAVLDLDRDGPTVVEIPPGCGPGTVDDAWFRFVIDMGAPGPRPRPGRQVPDPAARLRRRGARRVLHGGIDELHQLDRPARVPRRRQARRRLADVPRRPARSTPSIGVTIRRAMEFINASGQVFNTIHANNVEFYDELHTVIDREPVDMIDPETRGLLASIGIRKGQPFEPDEQLRATLDRRRRRRQRHRSRGVLQTPLSRTTTCTRAATGSAASSAATTSSFSTATAGERNLDARTAFFYMATVNTPAMAAKMIGRGSQYAWGDRDSTGNYLDGANNYRLNIPADVPAKNFWSIVVYDPQTRSELQTGQPLPEQEQRQGRPHTPTPTAPSTSTSGPQPPGEPEANWIQTVPGQGLVLHPAPLRPARPLVRQDLAARRNRAELAGPRNDDQQQRRRSTRRSAVASSKRSGGRTARLSRERSRAALGMPSR